MKNKKNLLNEISNNLNLNVEGIENYAYDRPSLIVANHTCLKDIFALPAAVPEACKIVLSSRLMWKRNSPDKALRRETIENSLYGIPMEVHGGPRRIATGIEMAKIALASCWSVAIFPEGAYIPEEQINRGRTGASRILFEAKNGGIDANLIPAAIEYKSRPGSDNLDQYDFEEGDSVNITFGEPIDYQEYYEEYVGSSCDQQRNLALHKPIDIAMESIAETLDLPYKNEYIELYKRDTIILEDGSEIKVNQA